MFNTDAILYFKRRNNTPSHKTAFSHSNFFFAVLNPHIFISSAQRLYIPPKPTPYTRTPKPPSSPDPKITQSRNRNSPLVENLGLEELLLATTLIFLFFFVGR